MNAFSKTNQTYLGAGSGCESKRLHLCFFTVNSKCLLFSHAQYRVVLKAKFQFHTDEPLSLSPEEFHTGLNGLSELQPPAEK